MQLARVIVLVALGTACVSPEAKRVRGGGAGADVGNRTAALQMHAGSRMYSKTPCLLPKSECPGALAQSGLSRDFPAPSKHR